MNRQENGQGKRTAHRRLIAALVATLVVGIGTVGYTRSITKAREATLRANLHAMNEAITQYHDDRGRYPATLDVLIQNNYLRAVPEDPLTASTTTWRMVSELGVVKVRSGSDRTASDGSRYADW